MNQTTEVIWTGGAVSEIVLLEGPWKTVVTDTLPPRCHFLIKTLDGKTHWAHENSLYMQIVYSNTPGGDDADTG